MAIAMAGISAPVRHVLLKIDVCVCVCVCVCISLCVYLCGESPRQGNR